MGTIFEASKLPLPKWFMLVGLMLNAKKGISAMEIQRHLGTTYKSAWYSAMRIRCAMIDQIDMLEGILEWDEAYIGGKPRHRTGMGVTKSNQAHLNELTLEPEPRTKKVPVVGIVEREGKKRVLLKVFNSVRDINSKNMLAMLKKYVNTEKAIAMTDEAGYYNILEKEIERYFVTHSKYEYVRGEVHTNTIEGVWSLIKRGIKGEYHAVSKKYLPFYLVEFAYKYNRRSKEDRATSFNETIVKSVKDDKCLVKYKPKGDVRTITYGKEPRKKASKKRIHKIIRQRPVKKVSVHKKGKVITRSKMKSVKKSLIRKKQKSVKIKAKKNNRKKKGGKKK